MNIEESEFIEIFWDVYRIGLDVNLRDKFKIEFREAFPSLMRTSKSEVNRIVRYLIYMYHIKSPLRGKIKNIKDRKEYAAKLAGYHGKVDPAKKNRMIEATDPKVVTAIYDFIRYINDHAWAQLISNELMFWTYYRELVTPLKKDAKISTTEINRKDKIRAALKALQQDIENGEYEIFGGDKEVADIVKEVRRTKTFPEQVAVQA